ncbi:MAG: hypothetical protein BTM33_06255, partial [Synechococcus sp. Lanier]
GATPPLHDRCMRLTSRSRLGILGMATAGQGFKRYQPPSGDIPGCLLSGLRSLHAPGDSVGAASSRLR